MYCASPLAMHLPPSGLPEVIATALCVRLPACLPMPRRDAGGYLYYIPSTESDSLVQIDLSDDAIVAQLFANHAWEELLEPLEVVACESHAHMHTASQQ